MKNRFWVCAVMAATGIAAFGAQTGSTDSEAKPIPRTADGKPDFTGFFTIQYTPNMAFGKEDAIPYAAAGKAAYLNHDAKDDPTANCWFPGVPRIMQSPYPAQFVQTPGYLVILFEYMHTFRSIPLNGRPHPSDMEPAFMGDSTGHWEGDTLVVDTTGLKGPPWTWLDTAGHQHSDKLHVTERFRRTANNIEYEYTVDDPKMYSKPWTLSRVFRPLKLNPRLPELIEYSCSENNKDIQHLVTTKPALGRQ
ncbi:MAG TPA: hypothetical protein VMH80_10315 [Bryobacteraceae bacterium]|nr:hypothetical protein [Bryobacteraceae bacterium]